MVRGDTNHGVDKNELQDKLHTMVIVIKNCGYAY